MCDTIIRLLSKLSQVEAASMTVAIRDTLPDLCKNAHSIWVISICTLDSTTMIIYIVKSHDYHRTISSNQYTKFYDIVHFNIDLTCVRG